MSTSKKEAVALDLARLAPRDHQPVGPGDFGTSDPSPKPSKPGSNGQNAMNSFSPWYRYDHKRPLPNPTLHPPR